MSPSSSTDTVLLNSPGLKAIVTGVSEKSAPAIAVPFVSTTLTELAMLLYPDRSTVISPLVTPVSPSVAVNVAVEKS